MKRKILLLGATLVLGALSLFAYKNTNTEAAVTQNDTSGYFLVDFNGNQQGLAPNSLPYRENININTAGGYAEIVPGQSNGYFHTSVVSPASFTNWVSVQVTGTYSNANDIGITLTDCSATPNPISGFTNLHPGAGGTISISGLNPGTYPCIRLKAELADNGGVRPTLDALRVNWIPLPVLSTTLSADNTVSCGNNISYSVGYTLSYVDDTNVIVWASLPAAAPGSFTPSYGQNLSASFVSATSGGQFTSTTLTLNSVTVPANSVYWVFPTLTAGTTGTLSFIAKTTNGTQHGVIYEAQSSIDSQAAALNLSDSNPSVSGAQKRQTSIACSPSAAVTKNSLGTVPANGSYWIYNGGSYTPVITYIITARNDYAPTGRETLFTPTLVDSIADIVDTLISSCGVAPASVSSRFVINNSGVLDVTGKTITWTGIASIQPGQSQGTSYTVDYTGCPDGLTFDNTVTLSAPNSTSKTGSTQVKTGFNPIPTGSFAKGEATSTASSILANNDDLSSVVQNYGTTFSYPLLSTNTGPLALGNVVTIDQIKPELEFVGASLPASLGGTIYYNTTGAANADNTPPDYNPTNGTFGPSWTSSVPSPASDVQWVASVVPCLDSSLFPAASGSCYQKPTSSTMTIQVKVKTPAGACDNITSNNKGLFYVFSAGNDVTNTTLTSLASPITLLGDTEVTHIGPALGNLTSSIISGPTSLEVGMNGTYTITITNSGTDAALNTLATVTVPTLLINGTTTPIDFVSATGGTVSIAGLPSTVSVQVGNIPAGSSKTVTVTVSVPAGIPVTSSGTMSVAITAQDDMNCSTITANSTKQTTFTAEPKIASYKEVDESLVDTAGEIHYKIHYTNIGESPTSNTYLVDKIPSETVFARAYTSGTDTNGNTFTCNSCSVYFADNNPSLPLSITPLDPFTVSRITTHFSPGTEISPGEWTSPFGASTKYVAYKVDNPSIGSGIVPTSFTGMVGLAVVNDEDGPGPNNNGSPIGTIITNQPAIVSTELSQAIGNQVFTTILSDPGLRLTKTSDKDIIYAGESFNWNITYFNDSANSDTSVIVEDTIPSGFTLNGVYHTWNNKAITNGASPSGEQNIISSPHTTVINNPDGTTTVRVVVSQGLRGGDLALLEGGTIRLDTNSSTSFPSGYTALNTAEGCFANTIASYCVYASDAITIQNPDLWLRKNVDNPAPVAGQTLSYTLVVSNEGLHEATQIILQDTLPAGLCYQSGSTHVTSPAGWTIGEPIVTGSCGSAQTLVWNVANTNTLDGPSTALGVLPGNSPDILINYQVLVDSSVPSGTTLTNGATISTNLTENTTYANGDNRSVTVPYADPYVIKSSPSLSLPGAAFAYTVVYGNNTAQPTTGTYIIDTLPDSDSNGDNDVTIVSVTVSNGEQVYYHTATSGPVTPVFDPSNPTAGGWSTTLTPDANYIAILIGNLVGNTGPNTISITAEMTDPETLQQTAPGTIMNNRVEIFNATPDNDTANNISTSATATPSLDLAVTKNADNEGGYPGAQPGGYLTYTINYRNSGTVNACDIHIEDMLPAQLDSNSIVHNFSDLSGLLDSSNSATTAVDTSNTPITSPVTVTFSQTGNTLRWDIGNSNTCLRPGAHGSFTLFVQILDTVKDSIEVTNTATIGEDSSGIEDVLTNNTDDTSVMVYRANVIVQKTGIATGLDMLFGTSDDSTSLTNPNETIAYTVTYNNSGNTAANDVVISDKIPANSCFVVGSLTPPAGSTVEYSNDNQTSWTYTPTGATGTVDCAVTHFRIVFLAPLPAPATFDAENSQAEFLAPNSAKSFTDTEAVTPGSISLGQTGLGSFGLGNINNNNTSCFDINLNPTPICTPDDLNQVRNYDGNNFIVMNDLDFLAYDNDTGSTYTSGTGWEPIPYYTGNFDGNFAIINNLFIDRTGSNQNALFAVTESGSSIHDLKLTNATLLGNGSSALLVAEARNSNITDVHVQGLVTQTNSGDKLFGGLVALSSNSTIASSSSDVVITLTQTDASGGLVGYLEGSQITDSKSSGQITAENIYASGGLVGVLEANSSIENSYTSTSITVANDSKETGGLAGRNSGSSVIRYSYVYGSSIQAHYVTGGFVGANEGIIEHSFAVNETTGIGDPAGFVSEGGGSLLDVYYNENPATPLGVCFYADPSNLECNTINNDPNYFTSMSNPPLNAWSTAHWIDNSSNGLPPLLSWEKSSYTPNGSYTTLIESSPSITSWDTFIYTQELPTYPIAAVSIPNDYLPYDFGQSLNAVFGTTDATDTYIHAFFGIVNGNAVDSVSVDDASTPFDNSTHGGIIATDTQTIQAALDIITGIMGYSGQAIYSITTGNQLTIWLSPALANEVATNTFLHMYAGPGSNTGNYTNKVDFTNPNAATLGDVILPISGGLTTAQTEITIDIQGVSGGLCDGNSLIGGPVSDTTSTVIIDISSIPASVTELCLVAQLQGTQEVTPLLTSWIATYEQSGLPYFNYQTKVISDSFTGNTVTNTAAITTTTPEISTTDNTTSYTHTLVEQDLRIQKSVDKASINLADVAAETPLTYTISVSNLGPSTASGVYLNDILPVLTNAPISLNTAPTSNGDTVKCSYDAFSHSVYCDDDGNNTTPSTLSLDKDEYFTITITTPVLNTITISDTVVNFVEVHSATYDTNILNNTSSATTVVGDFANIVVSKSGPITTGINKDITYTLSVTNNGNITADNVVIVDQIPTEDQDGNTVLTSSEDFNSNTIIDPLAYYVSSVVTSGSAPLVCVPNGNEIYCNLDGSPTTSNGVSLAPGDTSTISITLHSNNDLALLIHQAVLLNQLFGYTTTPQTNINDDYSSVATTIAPTDLSSISGKVWLDNANNGDDTTFDNDDTPLANVLVFLSGVDIYGDIYGPDKSVYPAEYESLMADLVTQCNSGDIVPACPSTFTAGAPYLATSGYSLNYIALPPQSTLANGTYSFTGLKPGTYNILEQQPKQWRSIASDGGFLGYTGTTPNTNPARDGEGSVETGSSAIFDKIGGYSTPKTGVVLYEGDTSIENNFIEGGGSVGNHIYKDINNSGTYDSGDTHFPTVEVTLWNDNNQNGVLDGTDTPRAIQMTDANGAYLFNNLEVATTIGLAKQYIVVVSDSANMTNDYVSVLGAAHIDENGQEPTGTLVTLDPLNYHISYADFGYAPLSKIGDRVWYDINKNGLQDASETGIAGISVELLDGTTVVATTVTDGNGLYQFNNVIPGNYSLQFVYASAYTATTANSGANDLIDSDISNTGTTSLFTVLPGQFASSQDAGLYPTDNLVSLGSIGGVVWYDSIRNDTRDTTEPKLPSVTVNLLDNTGSLVASTVTDANGTYSFQGLLPADYQIEILPTGSLQIVTPYSGGDSLIDSDFSEVTGKTTLLTLPNGGNLSSVDGGLYLPGNIVLGSISGTVWNDITQNNIQDVHETGVPGQYVELFSGASIVGSMLSDSNGNYTFNSLLPGNYQVKITPMSGWTVVTANQGGDELIDSDFNPYTFVTGGYTVVNGEIYNDVDAGLYTPTTVSGVIQGNTWVDANTNGIFDGEPPKDGVLVALYAENGTFVTSVSTDLGGNYSFVNILPGNYYLVFTAPGGTALTLQDQGTNDGADSDPHPTTGTTAIFSVGSGQTIDTIDAGVIDTALIGDTIFYDYNGNGFYEPSLGEHGINGVQVDIYEDVDANGSLSIGDTPIASALSGVNGQYLFTGLAPSKSYIIVANSNLAIPTNYTHTNGLPGVDNYSQDSSGYLVTTNPSNLINFSADFGWQPDANLVDPPTIQKTVNALGEKVIEWKMVWINQSQVGPVSASLADPIGSGQQYIANSISCQARGISTTTSCFVDTSSGSPVVKWIGTVGSDLGNTTEEQAANEIVITFHVSLASSVNSFSNQACGNWDQNGDTTIDNFDQNVATNSPVCSDDPLTSPHNDATTYQIPSQPLVNTGKNLTIICVTALLSILITLLLHKQRKGENNG